VLVRLLVEKKGTRSLTYQFRFYRLGGATPQQVARGRLTVVCAARQEDGTLKAVALPRILADKIQVAPAEALAEDSPPNQRPSSTPPETASRTPRPPHAPPNGARIPRRAHRSNGV
jgi:hypothetical protein